MKLSTLFTACLFLCVSISTSAQKRIQLSSTTTTTNFNFSNYTAIDVSGDFKVNLNVSSNTESIAIEANSNLMDMVEVTQEGTTLKLKLKGYANYKGKMILNATISTRAMVNTFQLSGDAVMNIEGALTGTQVDMMLKGDSILTAEVNAASLNLIAKSDSVVKLSGTVENVDASLKSDSILKAKDLAIANTQINLSGDSQAMIHTTATLTAVASGDSVLKYKGDPDVKKSIMTGDSEIHRM